MSKKPKRTRIPITPHFPGPATGCCNGFHRESNFLALFQ
jgi:hypothetical protein